jgi:AbrB family looped-hinge helix DNA binding protein
MNATIRRKGQLTIPAEIRRAAEIDEGDEVEFEVTEQGILLRRVEFADRDPWYYGTPEWEAGIDRALAESETGTGTIYESGEEFLKALRQMSKNANLRD